MRMVQPRIADDALDQNTANVSIRQPVKDTAILQTRYLLTG